MWPKCIDCARAPLSLKHGCRVASLSKWPSCLFRGMFLQMNFASTPTSILNLTTSQEREFDAEFNGIPGVRKYCQLFTHESNAFLSVIIPIETNACADAENAQIHARNSPFPLRQVDPHLTHECLGPPHSPRHTTARSLYALSHNDATKSPLVTMGRRKFTPQTAPSPSTITTKI